MQLLLRVRGWLIGLGVVGAVTTYILFARAHWMPAPDSAFEKYVCASQGVSVYYHHHANTLRMETPKGSRLVWMFYDEIDWGDYDTAASVLGLQPPVKIIQRAFSEYG